MRLLGLFIVLILLNGCAVKKEVVSIVVPCEVEDRKRPERSGDLFKDLKEIFIYLEGIENDLKFCKGELNGR